MWNRLQNKLFQQLLQGKVRIGAEANVNGGDLDDGAAGGDEPVEALGL